MHSVTRQGWKLHEERGNYFAPGNVSSIRQARAVTRCPNLSRWRIILFATLLCTSPASGINKLHFVMFGKPVSARFFANAEDTQPFDLKVRALYIDGKLREFTIGAAHEITDRLFTVRRAFRVNDLLPDENIATPRWQWQRGGWLLIDRQTGRISAIALPNFDTYASVVSWYRDYAAYCGIVESPNAKKFSAVVVQIARRKPLLKKSLDSAQTEGTPCATPRWQRQPPQVTFAFASGKSFSYAIHGDAADPIEPEDDSNDE